MSATQATFSPLLPFCFYYPEAIDTNGDPINGFNYYNTRAYSERPECGVFWDNWTHIAKCTDLNNIQIDSPLSSDLLIKRVSDGATVDTITATNPSGTIQNYIIDWSAITCNDCYYLEIEGGNENSTQLITGNDSTFDGSIGSATSVQTLSHETITPIRTGAGSLKIELDQNNSEAVTLKTGVTFTEGKNYVVEVWTYQDSVLPALISGDFGFNFPDFPLKKNIISTTRIDTSGAKDTWVKISVEFQAIETHDDDIEVTTTGLWDHANSPALFMDDFTVTESDKIELIRSEPIQVNESFQCSKVVTYSNDGTNDLEYKARLPMRRINLRPSIKRSVFEYASGNRETLSAQLSEIDVYQFDFCPYELIVKYTAFFSCDSVKIDGIEYISDKDANVDSSSNYSLGGAEFELIRKTATLINSTC